MSRKSQYSQANISLGKSIALSALAVLLGGLIYIYLRPSEHVFFGWIRIVGLNNWLSYVRYNLPSTVPHLPEWIIYSLPNGLWAFAYAILITSIWSGSRSLLKYLWLASIPLLVLGFELLQYPGIIPGTFSIQDLIFGTIGFGSGIFLGLKTTKPKKYEEEIE